MKKIIIIALIIIISVVAVWMVFGRSKPSGSQLTLDETRKNDMRQIFNAQNSYFKACGKYYILNFYPRSIVAGEECSAAAGTVYAAQMPFDPGNSTYFWIDNTGDNQRFCVFAILDEGGFYIVSHKGYGKLQKMPASLADCGN